MYEIVPNLYLSNYSDALYASKTTEFYQINVTKDMPIFTRNEKNNMYIRVAINDDMSDNAFDGFLENLPKVVNKIDEVLSENHVVVVHCLAGQQRSAAIVAAYLLYKKYVIDIIDAISMIKNIKRDAFLWKVNFLQPLQKWQHQLEHK